jgi:hypothetical protein
MGVLKTAEISGLLKRTRYRAGKSAGFSSIFHLKSFSRHN